MVHDLSPCVGLYFLWSTLEFQKSRNQLQLRLWDKTFIIFIFYGNYVADFLFSHYSFLLTRECEEMICIWSGKNHNTHIFLCCTFVPLLNHFIIFTFSWHTFKIITFMISFTVHTNFLGQKIGKGNKIQFRI